MSYMEEFMMEHDMNKNSKPNDNDPEILSHNNKIITKTDANHHDGCSKISSNMFTPSKQ